MSFEVHPQFTRDARLRGDVLIRCRDNCFYAHKSVLYFASPFFSGLLDGGWRETSLTQSTDTDRSSRLQEKSAKCAEPEDEVYATLVQDGALLTLDWTLESQQSQSRRRTLSEPVSPLLGKDACKEEEPTALQRLATPPLPEDHRLSDGHSTSFNGGKVHSDEKSNGLLAIIHLKHEDASTIQDVLFHIYPNLELTVTWCNISSLLLFADKYDIAKLRRACITFLQTSLAGKPIEAMALSEKHRIAEVYREASRHVLDNMAAWQPAELAVLGNETLLKLERRRTWFLERVLKLGLASPARDFECHAQCRDKARCARELEARWRHQYANAFIDGTPQPSAIWRALRELDNGRPWGPGALVTCQAASKLWVQNLFDRMYGLLAHSKTPQKFLSVNLYASDDKPKQRRALQPSASPPFIDGISPDVNVAERARVPAASQVTWW